MLRVKVTSNIDKFMKQFRDAVDETREYANAVVHNFMLASFEVVLNNTPVDTGQMMLNWHVYKHGGLRGFSPLPDYKDQRHSRQDYAGRMMRKSEVKGEQSAVLEAELRSLNVNFFEKGRRQVTVGLSNATPYGDMLDQGLYNPIPPLINLTASGYSIQAPYGIVAVSITAIRNDLGGDLGQFLNIGGSV